MTSVVLNPIPVGRYIFTDEEPQMIQKRTHNAGILYLDSSDSKLELDKTNMLLSSIKSPKDTPNQLTNSISRIKINGGSIYFVSPNVNIRNNNIIFQSSNTGSTNYSVIITEGFYSTASSLIGAIVNAMNSAVGTGLTFSSTSIFGRTNAFNLVSVGGSYRILLTCNAITNGNSLYALPNNPNFATTNIVGCMALFYTRYIDICSRRLNNYVKIPSNSTGYNSNIVTRIFIDNPVDCSVITFGGIIDSPGINFLSTDSLSTIDFQLRDQFGDLLYIPPGGGVGNQSGFSWDMELVIEF
jgi:hypothetical protein